MAIIDKKRNKSGSRPITTPKPSSTSKKGKSKKNSDPTNIKVVTIFAIILFSLSTFLLFALSSYLVHWQTDQVFGNIEMIKSDIESYNICGPWGSFIGYTIIGKWFGIMGILLPIPLMSISIYLMNINLKFFIKLTISTIGGLIIIPTALTFITPYADPAIFGGGFGGGYGAYLNETIQSSIGVAGTAIIMLLSFSIWLIYTFPYSFRWYLYLSRAIKHSANKVGEKINDSGTTKKEKATQSDNEAQPIASSTIDNNDENIEAFLNDSQPLDDILEKDNLTELIEIKDTPYTIKVNHPEEEKDDIATYPIDLAEGSPTEDGGFITNYEGMPPINSITQQETNEDDSKYDFKVSVTGNAVLKGTEDIEDTKIEVNELSEIEDDEFDQEIYDPTKELSRYKLPPLTLLNNAPSKVNVTQEELRDNTKRIVDTLENFNIKIDNIEATIGPTVTLYEIRPAAGVRISTIKRLEDDIALSLSALGIRIIAPIPGKDTVGIEVPNKNKEIVSMYSVIKSVDFQESDAELPIVLGKTIQNKPYIVDLAKMPHLLVAGATGQGKSVGLNAIITSLLYKKHPAELKFVMIDPKKVEFSLYSTLEKHYLAKLPDEEEPIIIDTQKVIYTLNSLCLEMDTRYELLKKAKVRNIKEYNNKFKERKLNPNNGHKFLPYFVVIIDEFGDLILTAGKEIETPLTRLAALARAVGIHLVIATQRPTTNIITGSIKANFPARMAFRVISGIDSKTILDATGASQLIGKGDMLILANNETTRVQCAFIDTPEVEKITDFISNQVGYGSAFSLPEFSIEEKNNEYDSKTITQRDALFDKVARYVVSNQQGSASTIQRNFEIGFNRAGRIMDQMERASIVGKQVGSKPRQVLIGDLTQLELHLINIDNPPYRN